MWHALEASREIRFEADMGLDFDAGPPNPFKGVF